jgi:UDP-GlcNAc3NAcA epimerase
MTVVGARPQFVKLAPLSRALRQAFRERLVHTGQHHDPEMSGAFFEQLALPRADFHLGIRGGGHGRMTGRMLAALEEVMQATRPDLVLVLGDTNSTLAGALAAVKLGIPVAHVEAGLRSFDPRMPEEVNRRVVDHISDLLLCPTTTAVRNLAAEGIERGVCCVGDVMMDAILQNERRARLLAGAAPSGDYALLTLHRQENVDDPARLDAVLDAVEQLPLPVLFPVHPRTRSRLRALGRAAGGPVRPLKPLPYLEMLRLTAGARVVLTDSGGLQKEAFILGTPCVTLRDTTEWTETVEAGANCLAGTDPARILRLARRALGAPRRRAGADAYGGGRASERIVQALEDFLRTRRRTVRPGRPVR